MTAKIINLNVERVKREKISITNNLSNIVLTYRSPVRCAYGIHHAKKEIVNVVDYTVDPIEE